jgi:hypothetical protein
LRPFRHQGKGQRRTGKATLKKAKRRFYDGIFVGTYKKTEF